jgi:hypothetical protein
LGTGQQPKLLRCRRGLGWPGRPALRKPRGRSNRREDPGASAARGAPAIYEKSSVKGRFVRLKWSIWAMLYAQPSIRDHQRSGTGRRCRQEADFERRPIHPSKVALLTERLHGGGRGRPGRRSAFDRFFVSCSPSDVGIQVSCWLSE